jgi:hypothetical protein
MRNRRLGIKILARASRLHNGLLPVETLEEARHLLNRAFVFAATYLLTSRQLQYFLVIMTHGAAKTMVTEDGVMELILSIEIGLGCWRFIPTGI